MCASRYMVSIRVVCERQAVVAEAKNPNHTRYPANGHGTAESCTARTHPKFPDFSVHNELITRKAHRLSMSSTIIPANTQYTIGRNISS